MLKIGIAGGRGLSTLMGFNAFPDVEVTAICDLNEQLLKIVSETHHIPHTYRIFEDMLESDIDAVVIATPMQCHVPQAIAALEAGKHILSEVTAGVTMDELWWLIECVEKYNKIYMLAENYCYMPQNQQVRNMVRQGVFGDVYYGEGEYLHEISGIAAYGNGKTSWRTYWQLGKRGAFYPTHSIGPVMQWFADERIISVSSFGTGHHANPKFRQDDTSITLCQLTNNKLAQIRIDCLSPRPHNMAYYQLQGTKGAYEAPRGFGDDHKIWLSHMDENTDHAKWRGLSEFNDYLPDRYKKASEEQNKAGHGGGDFFLVEDFINAIKTNMPPDIDIYKACEWTAVALLSELSVTNNGRAIDMPNFRKNMPRREKFIKL
ncbi:MAG: Gfo/Idh/MocA family oxidoreductase [Oscillospiraceae bacterium]|nr:Gfo/Idh/MocA family oxidoreductase [Oscillospiraceae bacterium]